MWTAYMLVLMTVSPQPMLMKDTRGPYDTEAVCHERVVEMISSAQTLLPGVLSIKGRCVEGDGDGGDLKA